MCSAQPYRKGAKWEGLFQQICDMDEQDKKLSLFRSVPIAFHPQGKNPKNLKIRSYSFHRRHEYYLIHLAKWYKGCQRLTGFVMFDQLWHYYGILVLIIKFIFLRQQVLRLTQVHSNYYNHFDFFLCGGVSLRE